jgi:hypothetical protein
MLLHLRGCSNRCTPILVCALPDVSRQGTLPEDRELQLQQFSIGVGLHEFVDRIWVLRYRSIGIGICRMKRSISPCSIVIVAKADPRRTQQGILEGNNIRR